jgi:hypothetical protein
MKMHQPLNLTIVIYLPNVNQNWKSPKSLIIFYIADAYKAANFHKMFYFEPLFIEFQNKFKGTVV